MTIMRSLICICFCTLFTTGVAFAANGDIDQNFGLNGLGLTGLTNAGLYNGDTLTNPPVIQPDGKILICGTQYTSGASGNSDFFIARFTANGTLDTNFNFTGKVTVDFDGGTGGDSCTGIALQADGKIVVSGVTYVTTPSGQSQSVAIARLNGDGTLDTASFNALSATPGKRVVDFGDTDDQAIAIAIQPDQRIVVAGSASTASNGTLFAALRLNIDGTPDNSFNSTGKVLLNFNPAAGNTNTDVANAVVIDAADNIVLAGTSNNGGSENTDFAVARLLPNGTPDPNFNATGRATVAFDLGGAGGSNADSAYAAYIQRDGKIVLAGFTDSSTTSTANDDMAVARLYPNGSLDSGFGIGGKAVVAFDLGGPNQDGAFAVTEQTNGKILLAGLTQPATGIDAAVVRLNADGSLDSEFGTVGKKVFDFGLSPVHVQVLNGVALQGTQIIASGITSVSTGGALLDNIVVRLQNDLLFADGFE